MEMTSKSGFAVIAILLLAVVMASAQSLPQAVMNQDLDQVKQIIEKDPAQVKTRLNNGMSTLILSVYLNNYEISEFLISHGADVNFSTESGARPVVFAAQRGDSKILELLRKNKADFSVKYDGNSLLDLAVTAGNAEAANYLVDIGFPVEISGEEQANQLLHTAVEGKIGSLRNALIQKGVSLKGKNQLGGSLLHSAAIAGDLEYCRELMKARFSLTEQDKLGKTPLHYAVISGNSQLVNLLCEASTGLNIKDNCGRTALGVADARFEEEICKVLKQAGGESHARAIVKIDNGNRGKSFTLTQVANVGFLMEIGGKKILIDALTGKDAGSYYPTWPEARKRIIGGLAPFDNIDLFLITHEHGDHFDPRDVAEFLEINDSCKMITTKRVKEILADQKGSEAWLNRIKGVTPEYKESEKISSIEGIALTVFRAQHDSRPAIENNAYLIECDEIRILHTGDFSGAARENHEGYKWNEKSIDLALLGEYFYWSEENTKTLREIINPAHVVPMHIRVREHLVASAKHSNKGSVTVFDYMMDKVTFCR